MAAAQAIPATRTAWYCQHCATHGSVALQPDAEAAAELVRLAHAARSPACDRQHGTAYLHLVS